MQSESVTFGIINGHKPHRVEMAVVDEETLVIWDLNCSATTINYVRGVVINALSNRVRELSAVDIDQRSLHKEREVLDVPRIVHAVQDICH